MITSSFDIFYQKSPDSTVWGTTKGTFFLRQITHNGDNCHTIAERWVDVNMKYYNERDGNPKYQGWYNTKGQLLLGWIC